MHSRQFNLIDYLSRRCECLLEAIMLRRAMHRKGDAERLEKRRKAKPGRKKARRPCGCGLNPIQGELEETGSTISRCNIEVFFIVVISDIYKAYIRSPNRKTRPACAGRVRVSFNPEVGFF